MIEPVRSDVAHGSGPQQDAIGAEMRRGVRRARWRADLGGMMLALPLLAFLGAFFLLPLAGILRTSVEDPVVTRSLPETARLLRHMPWGTLPDGALVATFGAELRRADASGATGEIARRLNSDLSGMRSLVTKTAGALATDTPLTIDALAAIDKRWGQPGPWSALKTASASPSSYYLLAALDLRRGPDGRITGQPDHLAIFVPVLLRTFMISLVVTVLSVAIAIPLAYFISNLPPRKAATALFFVMLPFWTSALVRITGWTVILQKDGMINQLVTWISPQTPPLEMLYPTFSK